VGWIRPIIYLILIGLGAYIGWRVYSNQKAAAQNTANQANALLSRPTPVQAVPVEKRPMPIYLTALGTVTPYYSVTVKARVNGQLDKVNFVEGQEVKAGSTILVIDPKPYQAALDQAKGTLAHDQALLKNAQAEYTRYKALFEAGVVSKEQLDLDQSNEGQYEGAIDSDKAAIETAQLQLSWCYIQSPITGKIGLRLVDPGNIITANTTNLVIVNQFEPIAVYFTLPENELPQVLSTLHGHERLVADAYDRGDTVKLASGQLLTADNQIDTTTGTDKMKAVFSNTDEKLFPNQFVNIHLVMEERQDALVVPSAAIQTGTQGTFVWVVQPDNTVKLQLVKVALAEGQVTILDSGVAAGQKVVVDGADRLRPGGSVIVSVPKQRGGGQGAGQAAGQASAAAPNGSAPPFAAGQGEKNQAPGAGAHHHGANAQGALAPPTGDAEHKRKQQ
jgi:multidrug efflux system membrane fusion protein